jgi:transcriptional regulator of acetoin/glycerol metabolism
VEREVILKALKKFNGNLTRAAEELGIGRTTLYRKLEEYGIAI